MQFHYSFHVCWASEQRNSYVCFLAIGIDDGLVFLPTLFLVLSTRKQTVAVWEY